MTQVSKDVEVLQEGTKAKIQAVEGVVKDMRVDMNKNNTHTVDCQTAQYFLL